MMEYLTGLSLLMLIAGHGLLIRGCFSIKQQFPIQGDLIASKIDRTADLLDEVAQLIADLTDTLPAEANTQPVSNPMQAILTSLISNMTQPKEHGTKEERSVHQTIDNPTQTQTEENEHSRFESEPVSDERHHAGLV
jgi:hypothetical protein